MTTMKRPLAPLSMVVLLVGLAIRPASAEAPSVVRVVNRVDVLSGPNADSGVLATVEAGTTLDVVDTDGEWIQVSIRSDGSSEPRRGWVHAADAEAVQVSDSTAGPAASTDTTPPRRVSMRGGIPPTGDEIRAAKRQRDEQARFEQEQQARIDVARQNLERLQQEYADVVQRAGESGPSDAAQSPAPASRSIQPPRPPFDLFGGYSLLFDNSDSLTFPVGWIASVGRQLNDRLSIVGEASGSYKSAAVTGVTVASASVHTFAAGPRFSTASRSLVVYGQLLGGAAATTGSVLGVSASSAGLLLEPGLGVDVPFTRGLAVRVGGEWPIVRDSGAWFNGFRMTTGLVMRSRR